ncbi:MAG: Transamidase GatB domain protein [Ignavibacteriae bacterium]|nr:MAG: Transamidase GatB domain protein [Ignavibacteriota bacterium]
MALKDILSQEISKAMKSGDKVRLETIRSLRAALQEKEIAKRPDKLTEDDELNVLTNAAKRRKESIELFEKGGRSDLAEKEKAELRIIEEFLPKQLSESELIPILKNIILTMNANSPKDFGKVMSVASKELKGKVDGKTLSEYVKKLLG